jgi:hypothetical protein
MWLQVLVHLPCSERWLCSKVGSKVGTLLPNKVEELRQVRTGLQRQRSLQASFKAEATELQGRCFRASSQLQGRCYATEAESRQMLQSFKPASRQKLLSFKAEATESMLICRYRQTDSLVYAGDIAGRCCTGIDRQLLNSFKADATEPCTNYGPDGAPLCARQVHRGAAAGPIRTCRSSTDTCRSSTDLQVLYGPAAAALCARQVLRY